MSGYQQQRSDGHEALLDLDGVWADFDRGVEAVTGKGRTRCRSGMGQALAKAPDFYGTLEMMHDAQVLWEFCESQKPTPDRPADGRLGTRSEAALGRRDAGSPCAGRHLHDADKHRFAGPGHVLVDDRAGTRGAWEKAGGIFILHTQAVRSIDELKRLGFGSVVILLLERALPARCRRGNVPANSPDRSNPADPCRSTFPSPKCPSTGCSSSSWAASSASCRACSASAAGF